MIMFVVFIVKRFDTAERHETEKISTEKGFYILKKEKITEKNIRNTSAEETGYCGNTLTMIPAPCDTKQLRRS